MEAFEVKWIAIIDFFFKGIWEIAFLVFLLLSMDIFLRKILQLSW